MLLSSSTVPIPLCMSKTGDDEGKIALRFFTALETCRAFSVTSNRSLLARKSGSLAINDSLNTLPSVSMTLTLQNGWGRVTSHGLHARVCTAQLAITVPVHRIRVRLLSLFLLTCECCIRCSWLKYSVISYPFGITSWVMSRCRYYATQKKLKERKRCHLSILSLKSIFRKFETP